MSNNPLLSAAKSNLGIAIGLFGFARLADGGWADANYAFSCLFFVACLALLALAKTGWRPQWLLEILLWLAPEDMPLFLGFLALGVACSDSEGWRWILAAIVAYIVGYGVLAISIATHGKRGSAAST